MLVASARESHATLQVCSSLQPSDRERRNSILTCSDRIPHTHTHTYTLTCQTLGTMLSTEPENERYAVKAIESNSVNVSASALSHHQSQIAPYSSVSTCKHKVSVRKLIQCAPSQPSSNDLEEAEKTFKGLVPALIDGVYVEQKRLHHIYYRVRWSNDPLHIDLVYSKYANHLFPNQVIAFNESHFKKWLAVNVL